MESKKENGIKKKVNHHINSIYEEGDLSLEITVKKYLTVRQEVKRLLHQIKNVVTLIKLSNKLNLPKRNL